MNVVLPLLIAALAIALPVRGAVSLAPVMVHSPRVANQAPVGTFAMPVSALRYEPGVDIHARNLAEGQADVTVRGGIFENTGFRLGALTLFDPQTGHYLAEIPVAPAMLSAPAIVTGSGLALGAANATSGAVASSWRSVQTVGALALAVGQHGLNRQEIYQGYASDYRLGGQRLSADFAVAHSESDGSIPLGDHRFDRANFRIQLAGATSQTDLFAGYQAKFFGWPNLYTPFNSPETEDLETVLLAANFRTDDGAGDFFEAGAYHRRNKDDYAFNRFAPVGPVRPFQHTTWVTGAAVSGRRTLGNLAWNVRAEVLADELRSTSLTFGRFNSRTLTKIALVPEKSWTASDGGRVTVKAGASYDDTNRDRAAVSPVVEVAREFPGSGWRRVHASYTKTTQVPTYTALNSSSASGLFRGNATLGRSTSHNLELGASGMIAAWSAQAAVFWRRDDRLVDWTFQRGVTARTANAVDIEVGGVEVVARRSWSAVDLVLGWTLLAKDADYRDAAVDASFYALNYARQRLTAAFTIRLGRGFELRMDNVARLQAENALRQVGGDEALTSSVRLAFRPPALRALELFVQAENLWDSDFQDVPAVPASRRQAAAGVVYAW